MRKEMGRIMEKNISVAVVGAGYWGPNLIRNFNQIPSCTMKVCCDLDSEKLERIQSLYPNVETTSQFDDVLNDPNIDAIAIATPVYTHHKLAMAALQRGKHVLVEKPLASSVAECRDMVRAAEENQCTLMVGHTFEYSAAVNKAKEIIESGEIGEIQYISSVRVNLGLFQPDINVIWDLAPHDLSIILYLADEMPLAVNAAGSAHYKKDIEDVATTSLYFPSGNIAFIHNSWLDPDKIRKITIVGTKKMLVYDDISVNEKLKIYDKNVEVPPYYDTYAGFQFSYRYGDIYSPRIQDYETLRVECEHFLDCIRTGNRPKSDGYSGMLVVSLLEAATRSLRNKGCLTPGLLAADLQPSTWTSTASQASATT